MTRKQIIDKQLAILEETVKFYSEDTSRRGLDCDGDCVMLDDKGEKCAIGRYIPHHLFPILDENNLLATSFFELNRWLQAHPTDAFKELLHGDTWECLTQRSCNGLGTAFGSDLQGVHDDNSNWCPSRGMTTLGLENVEELKQKILAGGYVSREVNQ